MPTDLVRPDFQLCTLLVRSTIPIEVSPFKLYLLIKALETSVLSAVENPGMVNADYRFRRVAKPREMGR
jgi:hypothetical protein